MRTLLATATILAMTAAPALAGPGNSDWGKSRGLHLGHRVSAPLPLAAGLPALALAGGALAAGIHASGRSKKR